MSFRFVPKSVTLNDLERRSGPYSALFHRIRVNDVVVKSPRSPSHLLVSFLYTVQTDKSSAAAWTCSVIPRLQPVVKRVWQPVACLYTRYNRLSYRFDNRLSYRFDNRFDNSLYRVNGAWESADAQSRRQTVPHRGTVDAEALHSRQHQTSKMLCAPCIRMRVYCAIGQFVSYWGT